jgi:inorganic pyrophosphatase
MHPWHDVTNETDSPDSIQSIIEIPKNSRAKYELDKESGMLILDRVLFASINYPANYGFIPQTYCDDNDPLDILVLSQIEIVPMCLVEAKIIGVMQMLDGGEKDDKIIAVAKNDMSVNHINDISELSKHHVLELRSFFEDYKKLEKKTVIVEEFLGKEDAFKIVNQSIIDYKKEFSKSST